MAPSTAAHFRQNQISSLTRAAIGCALRDSRSHCPIREQKAASGAHLLRYRRRDDAAQVV